MTLETLELAIREVAESCFIFANDNGDVEMQLIAANLVKIADDLERKRGANQ